MEQINKRMLFIEKVPEFPKIKPYKLKTRSRVGGGPGGTAVDKMVDRGSWNLVGGVKDSFLQESASDGWAATPDGSGGWRGR